MPHSRDQQQGSELTSGYERGFLASANPSRLQNEKAYLDGLIRKGTLGNKDPNIAAILPELRAKLRALEEVLEARNGSKE